MAHGTRHIATSTTFRASVAPDGAEGGASERGADETRQRQRRCAHTTAITLTDMKRSHAPERPETTKSYRMNDSPLPMPRVAKSCRAVVGRVHKTPPNHSPDISLSTPNPHAGVAGQRDRTVVGSASQLNPETRHNNKTTRDVLWRFVESSSQSKPTRPISWHTTAACRSSTTSSSTWRRRSSAATRRALTPPCCAPSSRTCPACLRTRSSPTRPPCPREKNGLGLRRRTVLARASFVATCVRSIPLLIDRDTNPPDAQTLASTAGFLPQLASVLGACSHNEGHEQQRFATFLQSGAPLARPMGECLAQLQAEQPDAVDGPLAAPPAAIGFDAAKGTFIAKFQCTLTVVREDHAYSDVDTRHRALPPRDQRRLAWLTRQARRRRREHGCCVGQGCRRAWRQLERRGRDVTLAIHGPRPADVRGFDGCDSCGWRYRRATACELVLAAGGGTRSSAPAPSRARLLRRPRLPPRWRQLERRGRDVTLAIHGARPADVRERRDSCGWRYRRATADELVLAAGGGTRQARRRRREHGCCVGHGCRRVWRQLERRGRDVTLAIHGTRLAYVSGIEVALDTQIRAEHYRTLAVREIAAAVRKTAKPSVSLPSESLRHVWRSLATAGRAPRICIFAAQRPWLGIGTTRKSDRWAPDQRLR